MFPAVIAFCVVEMAKRGFTLGAGRRAWRIKRGGMSKRGRGGEGGTRHRGRVGPVPRGLFLIT